MAAIAVIVSGIILAFVPTRAETHALASIASQPVRCGIPIMIVYGHARPVGGRQERDARRHCAAKARPRVLAAEILLPVGAAALAGCWFVERRRAAMGLYEDVANGSPTPDRRG